MTNLPQNLREFDDTDKARELIYTGALDAVSKRFPVEDDEYRIELTNPRYTGPQDFSLEQQKQALMKERRLTTPITGTWRLIHKPTNSVLDQRDDVVMQIPYYTQRGTFINGGNEYSVVSQSRLRPGVYVRRQRTGEVEAHFNVRPGKGKPFRIQLEPETGVFKLVIGQSANPLYPMLRAMGITDQQLIKSWGPDLLSANVKKQDARALPKIYQRMAGYKADPAADASAQERYLRDSLPLFELDADVNARTLGLQNAAGITPEVLLRTTGKMLGVSRGEEDADDRDSPQFSHVFSIEDMIRERIDKDAGRLTQQLLRKVRRTRNLQPVRRGALNSYLDSLLLGSGLAMPLEETNPLHTLEQLHRVTKLGEGGIGSAEAITDEARDVNPGQFSFIDPITGPEGCYHPETEVMTRSGWLKWPEVDADTELACRVNGAVEFHKPSALYCANYDGVMYGVDTMHFAYRVSGDHKIWCRAYDKGSKYRWEHIEAAHGRARYFLTTAEPYAGSAAATFTLPAVDGGNAVKNETVALPIDTWYAFLGWYVSEGSCGVRADGNHWVAVAQHDPEGQRQIEAVLKALPFPYCETRAHGELHGFMIVRKQLWAAVKDLGKSNDKRLPAYVFDGPVHARQALLNSLCLGDGRRKSGTFTYCTSSKALALDVERLAFGLGKSVRVRFEHDNRPQSRTGGIWCVHLSKNSERCAVGKQGHYSKYAYDGPVFCATVPGSLLYVRYGGSGGHWSGNLNIGIDVRTAYRTFKGDDNNIYGEFRNPHTGKLEYLRPDQAADKIIAFPGQNIAEAKTVYAMKRGRVERVPRDEVDYQVPSFGHMMSPNTNLNPMPTSVQPGRQFYGSKFWSQYMPQVKGEVPLVDSLMPDGKSTFTEHYGRKVGTIQSKVGGTVTKVTDDTITVTDADGKKHVTQLVKNFPFNRLTGLSYFPAVKVGDPVAPGDMVAHSNFTDAKTGALNMGHNLKTAIIPYKGRSYEDAYVISESAAQKMATERLYGFDLGAKHGVELGRGKYMSAFPRNFTQDQIDTLDGDGVVKPGTVLHKGDPIIVAVGPRLLTSADSQLGKLHKVLRNAFTDKSQVWEYAWPGTVTDVAMTHNGARVNVKSTPPVSVGDKLSTRFGLKGVVGHIVPDDKMPRDVVTNEPYELLLNPMAVLSRVAPNQIMEMALGKLAKIKGGQMRIPQEPPPEGWANWVEQQLREHGVDEATDLFDPDTGRTVKRIGDGYVYVSAFHHLAEKKLSSRGETGGYTCHDEATDVLTSTGWINWSKVKKDTVFATVNEHNELEFQRASAVTRKYYDGTMYGFSGLFVDYLVTPNHRMWVRQAKTGSGHYEFITAEAMHGKRVALRSGGLIPVDIVVPIVTLSNEYGELTFDSGDFSEFVGWYVAEGSFKHCFDCGKCEHKVFIWQNSEVNKSKFDRIFMLMERMGLRPYTHSNADGQRVGIVCSNKILAEFVSKLGVTSQDKRLPRILFGLGKTNMMRTLEAMLLGDGHTYVENGMPISKYTTSSSGLASDLQELAVLAGLGVTIRPYDKVTTFGTTSGFTCSICYRQHERTLRKAGGRYSGDYYTKNYSGMVYCATVPNGKLITRRNGLVMVSGNSDEQPARGGYSGAKKFCFAAEQPLRVLGGEETIGHIVEKRVPALVWAPDAQGNWGYRRVTNWFTRRGNVDEVLNVTVSHLPCTPVVGAKRVAYGEKVLRITKNHEVYTPSGTKIRAGELRAGDWVTTYGYVPTADQLELLTGSLLGDGSICSADDPKTMFYSEMHSPKQDNYVRWKHEMLGGIASNRTFTAKKTWYDGSTKRVGYVTVHRPDIVAELAQRFYPQGKKVVPELPYLSGLAAAVLFLDDGSCGIYKGHKCVQGNIAVMGFDRTQVRRLADMLGRLLGTVCTVQDSNAIYLSETACLRLARLVAMHVPVAAIPRSKKWLVDWVTAHPMYQGFNNNCELGVVPARVCAVSPYTDPKPAADGTLLLYDIEVEGVHRYCASDVVVSNSQMDVNAALAHGATDVIKDVVTIRGTKNEDFWKALKLGRPLPEPRTPFIYDKFLNTLRAGGINVTEKGDTTSLLPMTDDDVDKLSKGRIDNSDMVDSDFEPMRGGLFDPGRTGGAAGNRWTHIELPEPVPNPVMEEPVRRLLGLKIQDMEDILAGRKDLDGKTGGGALKAALDRIDIDRMLDEHKQKIRTLRGANRDNSMKILGYLASAKEQGIHPSKWMISKVPVLPPVFRPVSRMGDVALMADLNELYRDVIENAKSFQELRKDLPESELAEERLNLYKSVQAAYGLGESITPEGQSKRLKGAIRQVIGTSPKYGLFQSKVISKPVDVVGRGVVTPDPNLDMDQVGIPEDSAWALYKDFVMRGLVRHGYPALRASEMIEQRTPEAKDALEKEMQTRPVLLDRAPTWHKFNLLAFYPHITEGHTIRVSPLVTKGFNMDFDGDQANFHVPVSDKAVDQAKRKMLPSANLFSLTDLKSIRHSPSMEMTMGLYWLTRPAAGKPVRVFASTKAAKDAYRAGEIAANDPIEIRG